MKKKDSFQTSKAKYNGLLKRAWHHENSTMLLVLMIIVFLVVVVEFFFARDMDFGRIAFVSERNISSVLQQVSITGILAIGMTLVMIMGGIDLSIGQNMGFIGVLMAFLIRAGDMPIWTIVLLGVFIAITMQVIMGFIISRTRIEPFIVSLGFMSIYQGLIYLITNGREITMGGQFRFLGTTAIDITDNLKIFLSVLIYFALVFLVWALLKYTKLGRRLYAVGGNENAAYLSGINVKNFKLLIYGLNGLFVSIASMLLISRLSTGGPNIGQGREIDVIASVVVGGTALAGGKGNIWGTVIGVILLGSISNALNILGVNPYWQYIMKGALIVISVSIGYFSSLKSTKVKV